VPDETWCLNSQRARHATTLFTERANESGPVIRQKSTGGSDRTQKLPSRSEENAAEYADVHPG